MLSQTQSTFFSILSDYVNHRSGTYDIDNSILELARIHRLETIVYSCTNAPELQQAQLAQLYNYYNRKELLKRIDTALGDTPHFIVKGIAVSEYYPTPFHRTMGDTDIVINSKDRKFIDSTLMSMGFTRDSHYWYNGIEFELHNQLVKENQGESDKTKDFLNDFWPYVKDGQLDWSFHFLFLIVHMRIHMRLSGCGLRQFLDIAILAKNNDKLNWDWISEKAEALGLLPFIQSCLFLCSKWFDITPPIEVRPLNEETYQYITDEVLQNGVFGFQNKKTKMLNESVRNKKISIFQKISKFLRLYFPSYQTMKGITYYSFIEGKPYLVPAAWCYRAVKWLRKKKSFIKPSEIFADEADEDEALLHKQMMEQLGLDI